MARRPAWRHMPSRYTETATEITNMPKYYSFVSNIKGWHRWKDTRRETRIKNEEKNPTEKNNIKVLFVQKKVTLKDRRKKLYFANMLVRIAVSNKLYVGLGEWLVSKAGRGIRSFKNIYLSVNISSLVRAAPL